MGKVTEVDLSDYGYEKPVKLGGVPYQAYMNFVKKAQANPEDMEANCELLAMAIKDAPFPFTKEDLLLQDAEVIIELTFAYRERIAPLLARMQRQTGSG